MPTYVRCTRAAGQASVVYPRKLTISEFLDARPAITSESAPGAA
jgi:hypothetical protein